MRTEEQSIIIDRVKYINESLGVKAFAGTGKSFLLKEITQEYNTKNFLGLAFNASIVSENNSKFPKKNSLWFTVHGLARTFFENAKYDIGKIKTEYTIIELIEILDIKHKDYYLAALILEVFDLFCNSNLRTIKYDPIITTAFIQRKQLILNAQKEVLEIALEKTVELWEKFRQKKIKATHSFYLKLFELKGLASKITKFDYILLDEAQDTNPTSLSIINQIPAKKIFVGDPHQSIYAFRGVINAISMTEEQHYLSTTFRYQQHIADKASQILFNFKNEKKPIHSLASLSKDDKTTATLFRNNSSMIEEINYFIENNIKYKTIKDPKSIFQTAIVLLNFRLKNEKPIDKNYAYLHKMKDFEELDKYIKESADKELATANKMQKRFGKRLYFILKDAKERFLEPYDNHIILSTGHNSKGLEWGIVNIYNDFPDIEKLMKKNKIVNTNDLLFKSSENCPISNDIIQEINLRYVAFTRAKHTLNYHEK